MGVWLVSWLPPPDTLEPRVCQHAHTHDLILSHSPLQRLLMPARWAVCLPVTPPQTTSCVIADVQHMPSSVLTAWRSRWPSMEHVLVIACSLGNRWGASWWTWSWPSICHEAWNQKWVKLPPPCPDTVCSTWIRPPCPIPRSTRTLPENTEVIG